MKALFSSFRNRSHHLPPSRASQGSDEKDLSYAEALALRQQQQRDGIKPVTLDPLQQPTALNPSSTGSKGGNRFATLGRGGRKSLGGDKILAARNGKKVSLEGFSNQDDFGNDPPPPLPVSKHESTFKDPHDLFLSNGIKVGDSRTKFGTLKGMRKGKERDSVTKGKQDREVEANHWATVGKEKATRNTLDTTPSATLQGPNPQRANSRERDVDEFVDTPGLQGLKPNNRGRDGESSLELAVEGRSRSNSSLTNPMWEKMGLASMKYPPSSSSALKLGQRVPRRSGSAGAIARSDQSLNSDYESNEDSHHSRPVSRLEKVLNVLNRNGSEQSHVPANDGWGSSTTHQAAEVEVSNDLATRLNELAVANGDGLLSDEEYRLLRKGVFDEMMQRDGGAAMEIPKEPTFGWRTPNTNQRSTLSVSQEDHGNDYLSVAHSAAIETSVKSNVSISKSSRNSTMANNVSTFFKRATSSAPSLKKGESNHSSDAYSHEGGGEIGYPSVGARTHTIQRSGNGRRLSVSASSLLSSGDGHSLRPPSSMNSFSMGHSYSNQGLQRSPSASHTRDGLLGGFKAASISSRSRIMAESNLSAAEMERNYSSARSARSMSRASSVMESARSAHFSASSSTSPYHQSGVLSQGRSRGDSIVNASCSASASGHSNGDAASDHGLKSSAELRAEIAVLEAEGRSLLETFDGLEQVVIGKHSGLDHLILRRVVTETKSKFNQTGGGLSVSIVNSSSTAPPSSYKAPRKMSISSERYSATSAEGCLTEISAHGSDPEIEAEVESFRQELEEVALKKETVVKRYDERIGLLKSKLRSATIRESLIK